jgi:hypothetical protein
MQIQHSARALPADKWTDANVTTLVWLSLETVYLICPRISRMNVDALENAAEAAGFAVNV